jgi:hypothetical protein
VINGWKVDFIGIGAEKSGTSRIARIMEMHPDICMSKRKELHFFNEKDGHGMKIKNQNYALLGFDWYHSNFKVCNEDSKKGEFSPTYYCCPKAAMRIKKYNPKAKLICCIRNPIDRAFSQYKYDARIGVINRNISFEDAIKYKSDYLEKGLYCKHLKVYYSLFPKNQIHIVLFEDICDDINTVSKKLFQFLGVRKYRISHLAEKINEGGDPMTPLLNRAIYKLKYYCRRNKYLTKILCYFNRVGINDKVIKFTRIKKKSGYNIDIEPATRKKLENYYKKDIRDLEKLLNRDLSRWK